VQNAVSISERWIIPQRDGIFVALNLKIPFGSVLFSLFLDEGV